jgi:cytochrome bd-type quinol oxidase subunit 2
VSDRPLLLAHAVLGFAALFAATHHAAYAVLAASGRPRTRALQRFMWIAPATMVAQAVVGLAIYPGYRLRVRAMDLDRYAPEIVRLFDFKEHLAALAIALVIGASLAGGTDRGAEARWPVAAVSCTGAAFLWAAALIGLYVTASHPL